MQDKLKPLKECPFCGGEPFITKVEPHKHSIVNLPDFAGETFVECACSAATVTVEKWNTRAADKTIEALREALNEIDYLAGRAYEEYKKDIGLDKPPERIPFPIPPEGLSYIYEIGQQIKAALASVEGV